MYNSRISPNGAYCTLYILYRAHYWGSFEYYCSFKCLRQGLFK